MWLLAIRYDLRLKMRRPAVIAAMLLYVLFLLFAAGSGRWAAERRRQTQQAHEMTLVAARAKLMHRVSTQTPPWAGSAMDVAFCAILPPSPLADFAVGQADLLPSMGRLSLWEPDVRLFAKYELDSPVALARGTFDLSQAILIVLPLLLIALCFDVLSADRDRGRLGVVLAQAGRIRSLVWGRLAVRISAAWLLTAMVGGALTAWAWEPFSLQERTVWFAAWLSVVSVYVLFWAALLAALIASNRRGDATTLRMVLAWAVVALLIPSAVNAGAAAVYPAPSRLEYLARARTAENRALRAVADDEKRLLLEHPDAVDASAHDVPRYIRTAFEVTQRVDQATSPIRIAFERTTQQRNDLLAAFALLSPAIAVHRTTNALGGASTARHRRFQSEAQRFKADFGAVQGDGLKLGKRLSSNEIAALPRFSMAKPSLVEIMTRHVGPLAFIALVSLGWLAWSDRRLTAITSPSAKEAP